MKRTITRILSLVLIMVLMGINTAFAGEMSAKSVTNTGEG